MAFWDRFKSDSPLSDDELREQIFDAIFGNDGERAYGLLEKHQERVRRLFPSWTTVPEPIRNDRHAIDRHMRSVMTVAQIFEQAGDDSLLQLLLNPDVDNPMERLKAALQQGQELVDEEQFAEAIEVLEPLVAELRTMRGSFVDFCLPRACGALGVALLRTGRREEALQVTQQAIDACVVGEDEEGAEIYRQNLQFIRDWHEAAAEPDEALDDWDDVPPEELVLRHGTVNTRDAMNLFGPRAAAKALRYGRLAGQHYDEIAFRIFAATPATAGAHFESAAERALRKSARPTTTVWPRIGDTYSMLLKRVREPGETVTDTETGRFTFQLLHRATFDPAAAARLKGGDQLLNLADAPKLFSQLSSPSDAPLLVSQQIQADIPAMRWVPLPLLLSTGRFEPMQRWEAQLATDTQPRAYYCFVSHRWLTATEPDPEGGQAAILAWQLIAHLCDAVRVASSRGLHGPRMVIQQWAGGVPYGPAASEFAESLLVNLLRMRLTDETLKTMQAETESILPMVMDYGISAARTDRGLARLRSIVNERPTLAALLDHVFVWYDYSCLPQQPLTADDAAQLRTGLQMLELYQRFGRTVVLLDDAPDYVSRAWCTFEAMVANGDFELLVGSRRAAAAQPDTSEEGLGTVLSHRRFLVWRGILDTEVFGLQSVSTCMHRLGVTATEERDLPFLYSKYRALGMPTSVVYDSSEIVTGTLPLPVSGEELLLAPDDLPPLSDDAQIATLDWSAVLRLGEWPEGSYLQYPSFVALAENEDIHILVTGNCEGESIALSRFVLEHLEEAEQLMGARARSLSWLAADIVPVGHRPEARLRSQPVAAKQWLIVGPRGRIVGCKSTHWLINSAIAAGVRITTLAVEENNNNVSIGVRTQRSDPPRRVPVDQAFTEHDEGLYRDAIWRHLL